MVTMREKTIQERFAEWIHNSYLEKSKELNYKINKKNQADFDKLPDKQQKILIELSLKILKKEYTNYIKIKKKAKRFSFKNFAKLIIKRQYKKKADTVILLYGLPRTGKTTLGFDILIPYLSLMRKLYRKNSSKWQVPNRWSKLFTRYFAMDSSDMIKKIKSNPFRSFTFVDEGMDVVSWHHQLEKEQKELVELLQKTGAKMMLTIIIIPSIKLLTKPILARSHYLFIIPDEPSSNWNNAYLFKNYTNPILAENMPFGFKKIEKDLLKNPKLGEKKIFKNYLLRSDRYITKIRFRQTDPKIYSLYEKMVKFPALEKKKNRHDNIPYSKYSKLKYTFDTLLFNLKERDGKNTSQINRLLIDKFGTHLISRATIRRYIDEISAMQKKPKLSDDDVVQTVKKVIFREKDDVKIDD